MSYAPARFLFVTHGPLARNPRVVKEATTLGNAGFAVTVLGIRDHRPSVLLDRAIVAGAPFVHEQIDLLDGPIAWLRRARVRFAREVFRRHGPASIESLGPAAPLLRAAHARPANLTIVHNEVPHWVGTRLIAEGRLVAADVEDWHSEDLLPTERAHRPLSLLRTIERTLLHRAAYCSTTSHALADALHARCGGRRPDVFTNAFPLQPDPRRGPPGHPPAFFWFSQTIGPGRGLESFLAAWRLTRHPSRIVLLGETSRDYAAHLLALLPVQRRADVTLLPLVPPAELPAVIARHDIGLALEDPAIPSRDLTITNKILQYLNAGLAVVASETAGQREVLARSPDAGVMAVTSSPAVFAATLDSLLAGSAALQTRQRAARRLAEETYCWEREAPRLVQCVRGALRL
jgi:glycosyltransferase involved in cell wall biosynthesis